jgi:hypothetical protein
MVESKLIKTKWRVIRPGGLDSPEFSGELEREPSYDTLKVILEPFFPGANFEHVSVWADYGSGRQFSALDMFVDDVGLLKRLPRNEEATTMYRRANQNPEDLIYGPAVLFSRRVWF